MSVHAQLGPAELNRDRGRRRIEAWLRALVKATLSPVPSFARFARFAGTLALATSLAACIQKPTMKLDHAEVSGVRVGFPPSLGVLMNIVVAVDNPNSYDIAVRAVRGQVVLASRYTLPVDFRAQGNGIWLRSGTISRMAVPVDIPVQLAAELLRDGMMMPTITYRFLGHADVTATSSLQLEKDDYSVNEWGIITRQQLAASLGWGF